MLEHRHGVKRVISTKAGRQCNRTRLERDLHLSANEKPVGLILQLGRNQPTTLLHLGARQAIASSIGQIHGNRHLNAFQNVMTKPNPANTSSIQRQSEAELASANNMAPSVYESVYESVGQLNWDLIIQHKLEEFLTKFSNIPIRVPVKAADMSTTATVFVRPPYFLNAERTPNSVRRLAKAKKNRKAVTGSEMQAPISISSKALIGKSTPEEIQKVLQEAVDTGKLVAPTQKEHLEGEDLRSWLIEYGIGIDCSGFVSQAINEVMLEIHERAAVSTDGLRKLNKGAEQLKGGNKDFVKIIKPYDLRPGDTLHMQGHKHIRIMTRVESNGKEIIFSTAESHPGLTDVGPDSAFWRFPDGENLNILQKKDGDLWRTVKESTTFGRYEKLEKFRQDYSPLQ